MNNAPDTPPALRPAPLPRVRQRQSIFVSIASYCDPMLAFTIRSALAQAQDPARVFIGVVEQAWPQAQLQLSATWAQRQLRWLRVHALQARGPCWARAMAMGLYQGEDWFFQVDSHTWFEPGWDERLIDWSSRCGRINARHLISCYPNPFHMVQGEPQAELVGAQVLAHVVKADSHFASQHPVLMFEGVPLAAQDPVPAVHVGAGALWAPGLLAQALPYDPWLYFHGEEQAMALRAWTHGWDLFHVPGMPVYHLYHQGDQALRPLHWHPAHDAQRSIRSAQLTEAAHRRLRALLWDGADLGAYGLGRQRSLADYAAFSGIDYSARQIHGFARRPSIDRPLPKPAMAKAPRPRS